MRTEDASTGPLGLRPGMRSGEPLTDAQLFRALDLTLPGLGPLQAAVVAGDGERARQALYDYVRDKFRRAQHYVPPERAAGGRRTRPDLDAEDHLTAWAAAGNRTVAEAAADFALRGYHLFTSTGAAYRFDPARPFDYLDYDPTGQPYHQPLELYAMYPISLLRDAFFRTGERIYLSRAEEMVGSYARWYGGGARGPLAVVAARTDFTHPWENWTLPRRLRALVRFLTLFQQADLAQDVVIDALKVLLDEERLHVSRGPLWGGNWRQYMCADGAAIAAVFFEFRDASAWFRDQLGYLLAGSADLMPDGSQQDLSTSYGEGYLLWLRDLCDLIAAFGSPMKLEIPREVAERYEKSIDWQLAMRKPDGRDAQFNDNGKSQPPSWYGQLAGDLFQFFGREDLRWFASDGKEGRPPASCSYPSVSNAPCCGGMYVMRSDWSDQALHLVVDFGPAGGHAHPDYGSFILHSHGADLIEDGGCATYSSEAYRQYSVSPAAHNIISVDGVAQTQTRAGRPEWGQTLDNWITNPCYDYAWGTYPFEVVEPGLKGIRHRRGIYFAKPDYFLLLDAVDGAGSHRIRGKLQLAWDVTATVHGSSVAACASNGAALHVIALDDRAAPTIVLGQKAPFWDGWMSKDPHTSVVVPAPAVVYDEERPLPCAYQTLLYPVPAGSRPDLSTQRWDADEGGAVLLGIVASDRSYRDEIAVSDAPGQVTFSSHGLAFSGRLVHLRYAGDLLQRMAFVGASLISVAIGGRETVLRFAAPSDGYLTASSAGSLLGRGVYLDLSNRRESTSLIVEPAGRRSVSLTVASGSVTALVHDLV